MRGVDAGTCVVETQRAEAGLLYVAIIIVAIVLLLKLVGSRGVVYISSIA
jgi:hypothetical protein